MCGCELDSVTCGLYCCGVGVVTVSVGWYFAAVFEVVFSDVFDVVEGDSLEACPFGLEYFVPGVELELLMGAVG